MKGRGVEREGRGRGRDEVEGENREGEVGCVYANGTSVISYIVIKRVVSAYHRLYHHHHHHLPSPPPVPLYCIVGLM